MTTSTMLSVIDGLNLSPTPPPPATFETAVGVPLKLTAGAPLHVLVDALARAEWGALAGRKFAFIRALLQFMATTSRGTQFSKSGEIVITRAQIAQRCGYSSKTVQRNMPIFEDEGLLVWQRGVAVYGIPVPGRLKINKRLLVQYIHDARAAFGSREARRRARTRARLERFHRLRMLSNQPKGEDRGDTKTLLSPLQGRKTARTPQARGRKSNPLKKVFTPALLKKVEEMKATIAEVFSYLPEKCAHRAAAATRCNHCRRIAVERMYADKQQRAKEARAAADPQPEVSQSSAWLDYMAANYPQLTPAQWGRVSRSGTDQRAYELMMAG